VKIGSSSISTIGSRQLTITDRQKRTSKTLPNVNRLLSTLNISLCLYLITLITGCSIEPNEKIIEPELFAKIYVEVILQTATSAHSDSLSKFQMALDKYNVSREEFEASVIYYESKPELWLDVFTKIVEDLEAKEAELKEAETKSKKNSKD